MIAKGTIREPGAIDVARKRTGNRILKHSSREWLEFEKLVTRIEGVLKQDAVVKHNQKVKDYESGSKRQVDGLILLGTGADQKLITLECRKRKSKSDVRWLDELAGKQAAIRAWKTIAVCSQGLTAPAMRKARAKGIEVRRVDEISPHIIASWCQITALHQIFIAVDPKVIQFEIGNEKRVLDISRSVQELLAKEGRQAKIITSPLGPITLDNIIYSYQNEFRDTEYAMKRLPEMASRWRRRFRMRVAPNSYQIETTTGMEYFETLSLGVLVSVTYGSSEPSVVYRYGDGEQKLVEGIEFVTALGPKITVGLHKTEEARVIAHIDPEDSSCVASLRRARM